MDTAFRLYTTKGIVRTSISDIVKESGIAKGTFYLYFRDKYDLQEKLIAHKANQLFRKGLEKSKYQTLPTPQDKVLAFVDIILDELIKDKSLLQFINKNLSWGVFRNAVSQVESEFSHLFAEVLEMDDHKQIEILLYMIIEFVSSTCHSIILESNPMTIEEYRPYLRRSIRGIMDSFQKSPTDIM